MRRIANYMLFICVALFLSQSQLFAQSITISPSKPTVAVGQTVQFSAQVSGLASTAVTWSAGGTVGGSAQVGTISSSGLYTAPSVLPSQNPVTITATSTVNVKISGSTLANIVAAGPAITSVSPNPITVGNITVTITGSGFLSGATVLDTYGSTSAALSTLSVTATTITATGYQPAASSAAFCVKNPGTAYGNSISVPVTSPTPTYTLSVVNGSGGGTYAAGTVVTITANSPPAGKAFVNWTGASVANVGAATTTLTMPASNTTVTATYTSTTYALSVVNGSGGGTYAAGTVVTISANSAPAGKVFQNWTGASVTNANSATTTLTMPAAATTVTANYTAATATLTVVNGSGSGTYYVGTVASITANSAPAGKVFSNWTGANVANANSVSTTVTLPAGNTTVTANYIASTATLTVVNGTGSGTYYVGTVASITANSAPSGKVFSNWTGANVANANSVSTTVTLPAGNTTVTANYTAATYTLSVVNGTGGGSYTAGTVVTLTANSAPAGQAFVSWTGASVANANASTTTITMPASNTTVTANYTVPTYTLSVVNGTGGGSYTAGTVVTIAANIAPAGQAFLDWTGASVTNANAASTTLTMPAGNTTLTANFTNTTYTLNVITGTGSGTYAAGTLVAINANPPPAGLAFVDWLGASVQNPTLPNTTLVMPAANTTLTAVYTTPPGQVPFPNPSHPRLWITPNDLSRLQSWANPNNLLYAQGILPVLQQAINDYNTLFFPGGVPNPNYPDPGDVQGYSGLLTEQYGLVFAFNSLIDPSPAARIQYAQDARNLLMYAMNQAALGHLANAPFRDPLFAVYNRNTGSGEQWPLIVDWIYNATDANGNAILTPTDKATIRNVFLMWANDCLNADTEGNDHPYPVGVTNSPQLLPNNQAYRFASNNYYLSHARMMTLMALCIDPLDDPVLTAGVPANQLGNTLRSYLLDANGAWLYQEFAMMADPATVASEYGLGGNGAGLGLASGGLPPEGMLYGHSFGFVLGQLLALQTAGFNNASYSGAQIALIGAPVWDRFVTGYLSSLTPTSQTFANFSYLGPLYEFASYGDLLHLWVTPDFMQPFALLGLLDQETGVSTHVNAVRWFCTNVPPGGASGLLSRVTAPWSFTESVLYYLLLDPTASAASDPRGSYPTLFYDAPAGRILARSDWTPNETVFDYRASWNTIDHQLDDAGMFELFRNGEWLTKEMSNYDSNDLGLTTPYHNTLALQNWSPAGTPELQWFEAGEWANGSQWELGQSAGDPTTVMSSGAGYVYAASDLTNLYNLPVPWNPGNGATDITQATRSIVWLNNDYIIVYDRGTSQHSGLFKQFNLCLVNNPVINGKVTTETMSDGQQLFIQTLLPLNAVSSASYAVSNLKTIADLEPTQYLWTVQDPTLPVDTRFLHVLQGANAGASMVSATYLQSLSGTSFDGAVFGSSAVYFPVSASGMLMPTSYSAPSGVHTVLVTGLTPNASYGVSIQASGGGNVITVTPGGSGSTTDAAGVLMLTF